jgi:Domain of unknown function (DUF222)
MFDTIPSHLDDMAPGPELAAALAGIDIELVSGHDRVTVLRAEQRMVSHYQARTYRAMASLPDVMEDDEPQWAFEAAAAEIRAALHLTRRAADTELQLAIDLDRRLPAVWGALAAGDIDPRKARLLRHRTAHLSTAAARHAIDRVIEAAPRLTTGQLKARVDRCCTEAAPDAADARYRYAVDQRHIASEATDAGTANLLGLDLSPRQVVAITRRVNRTAKQLKTANEDRTMDQLRADVFVDLLMGRTTRPRTLDQPAPRAVVDVRVDLDTLAGLSEHPGELGGYGPVIADIARQVAADQEDAEWRYTVVDTPSGRPLSNGLIRRRRASAAARRTIQAHDRTCVFPGCRMPSIDCDLDHTRRWADGGPTTVANHAPLCRHDHGVKHRHGWTYRRLAGGDYAWTSRLGLTYTTSGLPP